MSKSACVGCEIDPSPAFMKTIFGRHSANSLITDSGCLNTHKSTPIRLRASTVSKIDSPF